MKTHLNCRRQTFPLQSTKNDARFQTQLFWNTENIEDSCEVYTSVAQFEKCGPQAFVQASTS